MFRIIASAFCWLKMFIPVQVKTHLKPPFFFWLEPKKSMVWNFICSSFSENGHPETLDKLIGRCVFLFPSWVLFESFQPFSRFSGFFSYQSHDELMINRTRALSPIIPDFPNENGLTPENEQLEIVLSTILLNGFWFPQRRGFVALFCFSKGCISSRKLQGRLF